MLACPACCWLSKAPAAFAQMPPFACPTCWPSRAPAAFAQMPPVCVSSLLAVQGIRRLCKDALSL